MPSCIAYRIVEMNTVLHNRTSCSINFNISVYSAATEDSPVSVCAYCTDAHAGVKWNVHRRNEELFTVHWSESAVDRFQVEFQCVSAGQKNNVVSTACRSTCIDTVLIR